MTFLIQITVSFMIFLISFSKDIVVVTVIVFQKRKNMYIIVNNRQFLMRFFSRKNIDIALKMLIKTI